MRSIMTEMTDFLKMDVFFAVTTVIVFFWGVMGMVMLYYMIKILRKADHVAENVSAESDSLRKDVEVLRAKVREEGMRIQHLVDFFFGVRERKRSRSKKGGVGD